MDSEANKFLVLQDLSVSFHLRAGTLKAVSQVNLVLKPGETIGIVGESGSGKSVMSRAIIRLNPSPPARTTGKIFIENKDIFTLSMREMRKIRGPKVSMIFQEPMTSLNPVFTIGRQITAGMRQHLQLSKSEAFERATELLTLVGIPSPRDRLEQYPHELSGGMRQRVMIAAALSCNPSLIIADEPTTALDVTIQAQILDLIADTIKAQGMSLILISHNLYVVADACERICVMYAGRQMETGPTEKVFREPRHPYTSGLKESQPVTGQKTAYLKPIPGMVPDMLKLPPGCSFHPRCRHAEEICRRDTPPLREIEPGHSIACHMVGYNKNA
jgi:oligopeptide/dipeptide ABC transporter ATP-binding protein